MSIAGDIAAEYYEPIIAQLKTNLAVAQAGLDRALYALTVIHTGAPGESYAVAAQALKDIAAITATLNKENKNG